MSSATAVPPAWPGDDASLRARHSESQAIIVHSAGKCRLDEHRGAFELPPTSSAAQLGRIVPGRVEAYRR